MSANKDNLKKIVEEEARAILSEQMLQEGIWSKMKNFAAKTLGTWEKGGKIRGRKKRAEGAEQQYVQAMQKLQKVASKESKTLIDRLNGDFKKAGYPNQEDKYEFLEQTMEIGAFYESLKKAVESKQMSAVVANELIEQLRLIVKKFLDYELADVYKHFSEDVDRDQDNLILEAIIREQQDEKEEGPMASDKKSTVVKGLKSNKLPAILAAIGAATILGKFLVESEWFKKITTRVIQGDLPIDDMQTEVVGKLSPEPGEGITQMLGRIMHGDASHFAPDVDPQTMFKEMSAAGIDAGELSQLSGDPSAFMDAWNTATSSGAGTLGEMFGAEPGALGLKLGKEVVIRALKPIATGAVKAAVTTTAAGKFGAVVAPYLAPLGISLLAGAIGVKALRMKGLKSSRAQVLNDLLQSLDYLDDTGADQEEDNQKPPVEPPVDFEVPVLVRFDDDDVKIYKLKANYLKKQGNRQRAEDALRALEKSAVMGRDLQESEAFTTLFEQDNDLDDTDSFEREFGRGKRVKDLRSAIRSAGRRRRLKSGARTKPVFYYVFDRSIQNDLDAMARGAKFNHFVSRVLRKAIAAVKANGNKPLTPEQAFVAIARKGGGGTGMRGLSIKEAIEMLRKYNVIVGEAAKGSPDKKASKSKKKTAQGGSGSRASLGKKARQRQRGRASQRPPRVVGGVTETYSDAIQEIRSDASKDKFNKLVEKLIK